MPVNSYDLELLWRRLEDAKLQLDNCHNYIREIKQDKAAGALPFGDGNLAHRHALRAEELAIKTYFRALNDFKEALALQKAPEPPSSGAAADEGDTPEFGITPREREVLGLVASGKSSREIAVQLGIAFKTVATHRYRLQKKLNAHHTADLTRIAIRMGLARP